jgi:hypothetical protein
VPSTAKILTVVDEVSGRRIGPGVGPGGAVRREPPVVTPHEPVDAIEPSRTAKLLDQGHEGLFAVAADAELDPGAFHDFPSEDREAHATEANRSTALTSNLVDPTLEVGQEPGGTGPEAIIHITQRDCDQLRIRV